MQLTQRSQLRIGRHVQEDKPLLTIPQIVNKVIPHVSETLGQEMIALMELEEEIAVPKLNEIISSVFKHDVTLNIETDQKKPQKGQPTHDMSLNDS